MLYCSKAPKHCALEPKISAPPQTPFPGARDGQNLISWRWSLPLRTNQVWWGPMHAISSYRGNRLTPPARPSATDRGDYNTLRRSLARSVTNQLLQYIWQANGRPLLCSSTLGLTFGAIFSLPAYEHMAYAHCIGSEREHIRRRRRRRK